MTTLEEARAAWQAQKAGFQPLTPTRIAYLGDGQGFATSNMIVNAAQHLMYARSSPDAKEAFVIQNRAVNPAFNKAVILGYQHYEPNVEQVLDFHYESFLFSDGASAVNQLQSHHVQHEFGGGDEVFADPRTIVPGLGRPTNPPSGCLEIFPFSYFYDKWDRFPGNTTIDIPNKYAPTGGSRYVTLSVDPHTKDILYTPGDVFTSTTAEFSATAVAGGAGGWGKVPSPPSYTYPIGAVLLGPDTTTLNWQSGVLDNITEARLHIGPALGQITDRLNQLESNLGLDSELPVAGADGGEAATPGTNAIFLQGIPVATTGPTNGQALAYYQSLHAWAPSTITGGAGGGETNTGSNIGNGIPVYREKSGTALVFRTFISGDNITVSSATSTITISGTDSSNAAKNLGTGLGVFHETAGASHQFKSIVAGDNLTATSDASTITLSTTDTSVAAKNLGTGLGVFHETAGGSHQFKSIVAGGNLTGTSNTSAITLDGPGGANLGTGIGVFKESAGGSHQFKTLVAGTNVTLASTASTVTITSAGGGATASPERHFNEIISASAWNNLTIPIWQGAKTSNVLWNQFNVAVMGGAATSLTFNLQKRDWGNILDTTSGMDMFSSSQVSTPGGLEATTFNDNASIMTSKQHLMFITGSGAASGGALDFLSITGYYTLTVASPASIAAAPTGSGRLLEDGTSYRLLEDGTSYRLLESTSLLLTQGGSNLITEAGASIMVE